MSRGIKRIVHQLEKGKLRTSSGCISPFNHTWSVPRNGWQTCLWCNLKRKAKKP